MRTATLLPQRGPALGIRQTYPAGPSRLSDRSYQAVPKLVSGVDRLPMLNGSAVPPDMAVDFGPVGTVTTSNFALEVAVVEVHGQPFGAIHP